MKRYERMSRADLELELATAVHERECMKLAGLFGASVEQSIVFAGLKIAKLQKLLAVT